MVSQPAQWDKGANPVDQPSCSVTSAQKCTHILDSNHPHRNTVPILLSALVPTPLRLDKAATLHHNHNMVPTLPHQGKAVILLHLVKVVTHQHHSKVTHHLHLLGHILDRNRPILHLKGIHLQQQRRLITDLTRAMTVFSLLPIKVKIQCSDQPIRRSTTLSPLIPATITNRAQCRMHSRQAAAWATL
ncbi:hypothetical protein BJV82DRAFT_271551 [Fennellomyces sp. T-0311]|nr:hypothetical protein BJV82DRAFT_271551 [Fennellomyces sp. T-0311]